MVLKGMLNLKGRVLRILKTPGFGVVHGTGGGLMVGLCTGVGRWGVVSHWGVMGSNRGMVRSHRYRVMSHWGIVSQGGVVARTGVVDK